MIEPLLLTLVVAFVLAAMFAPLEALRWWATQGALEARETAAALRIVHAATESAADAEETAGQHSCYIVYLPGIAAISDEVSPVGEEPMLEALRARLPGTLLISDVYPYSPANRSLVTDRWSSWWWRLVDRLGRIRPMGFLLLLVSIRNILQFAVSADDRYGPMYSLGVARVIWTRLLDAGYRPGCRRPVVLFGWSGGAQIALSAAWYLAGAGMPLYLLSLGGVITSDPGLDRVRHLWHLTGSRDWIQAIGQLFPGRWPGRRTSFWARAVTDGRVSIHHLGPMRHLGRGSYLSRSRTADGRTSRERVVDEIVGIIRSAGLDGRPDAAAGPEPGRPDRPQ
jgi:hypothetical protein